MVLSDGRRAVMSPDSIWPRRMPATFRYSGSGLS